MAEAGRDDRTIEPALRELLASLDRHLERGRTLLAAALVLAPAPFILLWLLTYLEAKHAAGWTVVAFAVLVVSGLAWETLMDRLVRWRFDRRFPPGSPARATALDLLARIETPNKVEEKLREVGAKPLRREGERDGRWVLIDYGEIVVHVQHEEERQFYALERLWRDCPAIALPADVVTPSR